MANQHTGHHLTPLGHYFKVIGVLFALTLITVAASRINLGHWNTPIAMFIAVVKAFLVMMIFMGLKWDSTENNLTIFSSLIFLAIFVWLTANDLFYRQKPEPVKVEKVAAAAGVDVDKLIKPTPELVKRGEGIFKQNCAMCHGENGEGNGPAASALNPKPRNFRSPAEKWKQGKKVVEIVHTLTIGVKGSAMPAFSSIPLEDRFALAHFVRSMGQNMPQDTAKDIEASGFKGGEKVTPKIPVEAAMEIMVRDAKGKR